MLENMRNYLLSSNMCADDKRYTMNFCKKIQYLDELHQYIAKDTGEHVSVGYGNVNSRVCIVVQNEKALNVVKPLIQSVLNKFNMNFWDIYITFVDKTEQEYAKKYSVLVNEIHAINPGILYVLDKDDTIYSSIMQELTTRNVNVLEKHFNIEIELLASTDVEVRKALWQKFKYLINYKE